LEKFTRIFNVAEADMIDSMYSLGGLVGSLSYGYVCDKIGRKMALNTIVVPQVIAYLLIGLSQNSMMILISRLFSGFSGGALYITVPLFVSEIAEVM
jgi:MFS family permease